MEWITVTQSSMTTQPHSINNPVAQSEFFVVKLRTSTFHQLPENTIMKDKLLFVNLFAFHYKDDSLKNSIEESYSLRCKCGGKKKTLAIALRMLLS